MLLIMRRICVFPAVLRGICVLGVAMAAGVFLPGAVGQDAPQIGPPAASERVPAPPQAPAPDAAAAGQAAAAGAAGAVAMPMSMYDKAIFQTTIPAGDLTFLSGFAGMPANSLVKDKQYGKLMKSVIPNVMFHYGSDKALDSAMDEALRGSKTPVLIRDGRYVMVSGQQGAYLLGRGFMWIDMQDGIALGGFYFHPTNGEPTPTVTIFSKQMKEKYLEMGQLPPAFAQDLAEWSQAERVPPVTTRYFISDAKKRILLEHDEDYCLAPDGTSAPPGDPCELLNLDAADTDLTAAYYLEQIHYATNGTAWMITGADQVSWIQLRDNTCGIGPTRAVCRVRMTHEHIGTVIHRPPVSRPGPVAVHR